MKMVKKKRLSEIVADEIKHYIKKEKLSTGDRLPPVAELMDSLGIGRSTLREALQLLESQDVLEIINGKGTYIKDVKPFYIRTAFDVENEKKFLLDALDVRVALEGKAVDLALNKATEQDLEIMQKHLTDYVNFINDGKRDLANQADAGFHQALYNAANNPLLSSIIDSVWDTFHQFWNEPFGQDDIFDQSYPFHVALLEAIRKGNKEEAADAFQSMMNSVKTAIEKYQQ
ncbi:FadR/GntR family transcriptional regulator [Virgibacillus senegalensis]|uniref:FadR/GntR family transcriptional regulator n=1 Tax=Virgibacillus senegalensis TaxID=1499679 RepID=UPI00069FC943|nr:FadR/GntR family transcriptional regulator [Virgibacillus senegalensis]